MFPNRVYFDLNSNDHWNSWIYWWNSSFWNGDWEYKCKVNYLGCINNHTIENCTYRRKLEENPFTRPLK